MIHLFKTKKHLCFAIATVTISGLVLAHSQASTTGFSATPLTDFAAGQKYLGTFSGYLYDGSNFAPSAHDSEGQIRASQVTPRDGNGNPSLTGKIVLLSIGMSTASLEWCGTLPSASASGCSNGSFMQKAAADQTVNHKTLAIVNGCLWGHSVETWLSATSDSYASVQSVLEKGGYTEKQVQVIWLKDTLGRAVTVLPASNADAHALEGDLATVVRTLKTRYPNLQQVFLTSRSYGGYGCSINPEPEAYETGYAVKWVVKAQIDQMASGGTAVDSQAGDLNYNTVAPWIVWGPYIWASGATPRSDGLFWLSSDYRDGCHPTAAGVTKASNQFMNFFKTSAYSAPWFLAH